MCRQFGFEVADLAVQLDDDADRGPGRRGECGGTGARERFGAQHGRNLLSAGIEVALSPSVFEGRPDLRQAQMRGFSGRGSAAQNGQGIAVVQIVERLQR